MADSAYHRLPERRVDGPPGSGATLVLAHGAGQDMDAPFMQVMARAISECGIRVVRFNFPYMTRTRIEGGKRPPDRQAVLLEAFGAVIASQPEDGVLFIGGKSLGGRMASLIADEAGVAGLVCLGYPFHPPRRLDKLRTSHFEGLTTPALICQGTRDSFGNREEVTDYALSPSIRMAWVEDGDHSLVPRRSSGRTHSQNLAEAASAVVEFVRRHSPLIKTPQE